MTMTDSELKSKCFTILSEQVGNVEMERFIMLLNRDTFDYTEWRKDNLFQGETVDSLCDQIERFQGSCENARPHQQWHEPSQNRKLKMKGTTAIQ